MLPRSRKPIRWSWTILDPSVTTQHPTITRNNFSGKGSRLVYVKFDPRLIPCTGRRYHTLAHRGLPVPFDSKYRSSTIQGVPMAWQRSVHCSTLPTSIDTWAWFFAIKRKTSCPLRAFLPSHTDSILLGFWAGFTFGRDL